MARGPKKHLKRLAAPSQWMLDKLSGVFAPRPRAGPHKLRECLPLTLLLRNRLRYAMAAREVSYILSQRKVLVDGKPRTDPKYPAGLMDMVSIPDTNECFRILLDVKGRTCLTSVPASEQNRKLLRVINSGYSANRTPFIGCHDGRVIRFPDPNIRRGDTVIFNLETGKIEESMRFKIGSTVMCTGGANTGRVGQVVSVEKHPGSFHICHVEDAAKNRFATRLGNVFVIGHDAPVITLPKAQGLRMSLIQDRITRMENYARNKAPQGKKAKKIRG